MKCLAAYAFAVLAMLAGCANMQDKAASDAAAAAAAKPPAEPEPAEPDPVEPKPPAQPALSCPTLGAQAARSEVMKILRQSYDWLDAGDDEKPRHELACAQQYDPENKHVACLLRGLTADPETALGAESTPYVVRPGDSLGTIAKRFMGDVCEFWILARYNQIKVPKHLSAGQTLRIPGKVATPPPPPPPPPLHPPSPVVRPVVRPDPKPKLDPVAKPEPPPVVEAKPRPPEPSPQMRQAEIERHYRNGVGAYRRQALRAAIREFDAVLALDPNHNGAKVYRQQALDLEARMLNK